MKPEETFSCIEDALRHASEDLAEKDHEIREVREMHRTLMRALGRVAEAHRQSGDQELHALIEGVNRVIRREIGSGSA